MEKRVRKVETPEPILATKTFPPRDIMEEMSIFYDFLAKGIDKEDIAYLQKSYELLLSQEALQVITKSKMTTYVIVLLRVLDIILHCSNQSRVLILLKLFSDARLLVERHTLGRLSTNRSRHATFQAATERGASPPQIRIGSYWRILQIGQQGESQTQVSLCSMCHRCFTLGRYHHGNAPYFL